MAEEKEPKKVRKTTLIKHKKAPADKTKSEKKKVVVVKKKPTKSKVVVKRVAAKKKMQTPAEEQPEGKRPSRPGYLGSSPREPSPYERYSLDTKKEKARGAGDVGANERRPAARAGGRTHGGRAATEAPRIRRTDRPGTAGGGAGERRATGRPGGWRRTGEGDRPGRGQTGPPPAPSKDAKQGGKRFFKTKKRSSYQKRKQEQIPEKVLQVKKKSVKRANPVPKEISILEAISVSELARKMNLKASELIGKLMGMGMMVTINQQIDSETAAILADEYGCKVNVVSLYDETVIEEEEDREEDRETRPPIVTVMGHVDHGKTKLLDAIRSANVVDTESGGITQHIGAYTTSSKDHTIVFLDTPGHEAFTAMRARGAQITDIVVLVVAADDGVMPQTVEAINHAKAAGVPIIVAVNKTDLPEANVERVKQQLAKYDLLPEEWGGHALFSEVSALKREGIQDLLDNIMLQAEMLELTANPGCRAQGRVIESKVDFGRGSVATVLVRKGTLRTGDSFVAGIYPGKIRAMFNDKGEKIEAAPPSIPVEITGLTGLPNAGDPFHVTESEKTARQIGLKRQELKKMEDAQNVNKITLDNLYDQIQQGNVQELKVIIKGDVIGSVEALQNALEKLSTDEIKLTVIHASAGAINDNDVLLATAYNAIVVGFHVRPTPSAQQLADREKVDIRKYTVIYEAVDSIKSAMEGMLAPEVREEVLGTAEVRETFKVPRTGTIAGSYVDTGKVVRGAHARLIREGVEIYSGRISSLKRFKEDAREVESGFECGIGIENYNDVKVGDRIEVYQLKEYAKTLSESRRDEGDTEEED